MPDHVFAAYSLTPEQDGQGYVLKTVHLDKETRALVHDECYIDAEEKNPISGAMPGQLSVKDNAFDVKRGPHKEAFEAAVASKEALDFEQETGINREVYATMMVMEDQMGMENAPDMVQAMEARQAALENEFTRDSYCKAPKDFEDKVVGTVVTKDELYLITADGHMFEATDKALEGVDTSNEFQRSQAILTYSAQFEHGEKATRFYSVENDRNLSGAAMEHQTDGRTAGTAYEKFHDREDFQDAFALEATINKSTGDVTFER